MSTNIAFDLNNKQIFMGCISRIQDGNMLRDWNNDVLVAIASSTFTDTKPERDIVMNELLSLVRVYARENGVRVLLFDMRYLTFRIWVV